MDERGRVCVIIDHYSHICVKKKNLSTEHHKKQKKIGIYLGYFLHVSLVLLPDLDDWKS